MVSRAAELARTIAFDTNFRGAEPLGATGAHAQRLSDVLFEQPIRSFASLAAVPSNVAAIEAALLFATGDNPFVAIVGPSGWGKSHLLESAASSVCRTEGSVISVYGATEWALGMVKCDSSQPLLLDNAQEAVVQARTRQALRLALERRVRSGRRTLLGFTGPKPNRAIKNLLPSYKSWVVASIDQPQPMERLLVLRQMALAEGMSLSSPLIKLVAFRMRGNGRTLTGALKRMKLHGSSWLDTRSTLRACGILDPFFVDNSGWDLRESIFTSAEAVAGSDPLMDDIAMYVMLKEAALSESQVARFFSVEPSEAYLRATGLGRRSATCPELTNSINKIIESVVNDLLQD